MGELDEVGRLRAYVADLQSSLNAHLAGLGSHERLEIDGEWGEHTALAFGRVCRVLGLEPERNVRTFRARRRGHAAAHAGGARARPGRRRRLRPAPAPSLRPRARPTPAVAAAIRASRRRRRSRARSAPTAGASSPLSCARRGASRLPVALACAILEKETGFRNVFGHDAVRNPVKSPPGGLLAVTQDNYASTCATAARGSATRASGRCSSRARRLQDRADQLGGCWKPGPNIRVGLEFLAGNIRRMGLRAGVVAYNGSGPAAQRYGDDVLARARRWDARLRGARPPRPSPTTTTTRPRPRARPARRGPSAWSRR